MLVTVLLLVTLTTPLAVGRSFDARCALNSVTIGASHDANLFALAPKWDSSNQKTLQYGCYLPQWPLLSLNASALSSVPMTVIRMANDSAVNLRVNGGLSVPMVSRPAMSINVLELTADPPLNFSCRGTHYLQLTVIGTSCNVSYYITCVAHQCMGDCTTCSSPAPEPDPNLSSSSSSTGDSSSTLPPPIFSSSSSSSASSGPHPDYSSSAGPHPQCDTNRKRFPGSDYHGAIWIGLCFLMVEAVVFAVVPLSTWYVQDWCVRQNFGNNAPEIAQQVDPWMHPVGPYNAWRAPVWVTPNQHFVNTRVSGVLLFAVWIVFWDCIYLDGVHRGTFGGCAEQRPDSAFVMSLMLANLCAMVFCVLAMVCDHVQACFADPLPDGLRNRAVHRIFLAFIVIFAFCAFGSIAVRIAANRFGGDTMSDAFSKFALLIVLASLAAVRKSSYASADANDQLLAASVIAGTVCIAALADIVYLTQFWHPMHYPTKPVGCEHNCDMEFFHSSLIVDGIVASFSFLAACTTYFILFPVAENVHKRMEAQIRAWEMNRRRRRRNRPTITLSISGVLKLTLAYSVILPTFYIPGAIMRTTFIPYGSQAASVLDASNAFAPFAAVAGILFSGGYFT